MKGRKKKEGLNAEGAEEARRVRRENRREKTGGPGFAKRAKGRATRVNYKSVARES